jgi:two-component system response regulator HydG
MHATPRTGFTILVVDDDTVVRRVFVETLESAGYVVLAAGSAVEARRLTEAEEPALAVVDLVLSDGDGISLLGELRATWPAMPGIVVTAYVEPRSIVEAMRRGAVDYLPKPVDPDELLSSVRAGLSHRTPPGVASPARTVPLVGDSAVALRLRDAVQRLARTRPRGVLITGEAGSGKTWAAQALHAASSRRDAPCLFHRCDGAYAPTTALFGIGRETGGLLAAAAGGTIVLDDVDRLDALVQAELLEWLDRGRGQMPLLVGLTESPGADTPLAAWLGRASIEVPPLRDRGSDVLLLARHFVDAARPSTPGAGFTRAAEQRLVRHPWPGNVRELRDAVARAAASAPGPVIDVQHLQLASVQSEPAVWMPVGEARPLREVVAAYIDHVMAVTGGNKTRAARLLGVARETLRSHVIARHGGGRTGTNDAGTNGSRDVTAKGRA